MVVVAAVIVVTVTVVVATAAVNAVVGVDARDNLH